jgi:anaerobic selenocysteine-containing dehydrogenase
MGIKNGDLVSVENPQGKSTKGKVFASGGIRPGVIKIGFATGGRFSPGLGPAYKTRAYTPNHNDLVDPSALSPVMGFPAYADVMVNIRKLKTMA